MGPRGDSGHRVRPYSRRRKLQNRRVPAAEWVGVAGVPGSRPSSLPLFLPPSLPPLPFRSRGPQPAEQTPSERDYLRLRAKRPRGAAQRAEPGRWPAPGTFPLGAGRRTPAASAERPAAPHSSRAPRRGRRRDGCAGGPPAVRPALAAVGPPGRPAPGARRPGAAPGGRGKGCVRGGVGPRAGEPPELRIQATQLSPLR